MRDFLNEYRPLFLKHARNYVRANAEIIAAEDVAREMELELTQLGKLRGLAPEQIAAPDALVRAIVKHAAGRAKRRRKLVEQVAAGDDLQAVSEDLASLDGDLPDVKAEPSAEAKDARTLLDRVKAKLAPRDALIFAVLFEDETTTQEAARVLSAPLAVVEEAHARILKVAGEIDIGSPASSRPSLVDEQERA